MEWRTRALAIVDNGSVFHDWDGGGELEMGFVMVGVGVVMRGRVLIVRQGLESRKVEQRDSVACY